MAQVITQIEMMRYQGAPLAVFPEGTILTPSAKDWAKEQGIEVVGSVIRQYRSLGKSIVKEEAAEAVCQVLSKLECTVE